MKNLKKWQIGVMSLLALLPICNHTKKIYYNPLFYDTININRGFFLWLRTHPIANRLALVGEKNPPKAENATL